MGEFLPIRNPFLSESSWWGQIAISANLRLFCCALFTLSLFRLPLAIGTDHWSSGALQRLASHYIVHYPLPASLSSVTPSPDVTIWPPYWLSLCHLKQINSLDNKARPQVFVCSLISSRQWSRNLSCAESLTHVWQGWWGALLRMSEWVLLPDRGTFTEDYHGITRNRDKYVCRSYCGRYKLPAVDMKGSKLDKLPV